MIIIGEKINASIPKTKKAILGHDKDTLVDLAVQQEKAGAKIIDVNVGTGSGGSQKECDDMKWLLDLLKDKIKGKVCIDSADPKVLDTAVEHARDQIGFINSVKAVDEKIEEILPIVAKAGVPVIGLSMDESGIPREVSARIKACEKILKGAEKFNVPKENLFFDPLVMPISTENNAGRITLETLSEVKNNFPESNSCLAVSNASFGLPLRSLINRTMVAMGIFLSVDALLINPLDSSLMSAVKASDVIMGKDRHCRKYSRAYRKGSLKK